MTEQRKTKEQMAEEYCEKFVNEYGLYGQMSNPPLRSAAEGFRIGFFAGYSAALSELEQREREAFEAGRETIQGQAVSGRISSEILNDPFDSRLSTTTKSRGEG